MVIVFSNLLKFLQAELEKKYKLCEDLTEEIREYERECHQLQAEQKKYEKKDAKSQGYHRKRSRTFSSSEPDLCCNESVTPTSSNLSTPCHSRRSSLTSMPFPSLIVLHNYDLRGENVHVHVTLDESEDVGCTSNSDGIIISISMNENDAFDSESQGAALQPLTVQECSETPSSQPSVLSSPPQSTTKSTTSTTHCITQDFIPQAGRYRK